MGGITPPGRPGRPLGLLLGIDAAMALVVATQVAAAQFDYARFLGTPLVVVTKRFPVYSPVRLLAWLVQSRRTPAMTPVIHYALLVLVLVFLGALVVSLLVTRPQTLGPPSASHGSARWGTGETLRQPHGVLLGRLDGELLRYRGEGHLLTVAPTRSGKGISLVIPNLLTYPGSVVVSDPKGENYAVTARRRRELGTVVHAIDPFEVVGGQAAFNPLALIDVESADALDDARLLADMLVVVDGREVGELSFWNEEARALLSGLILYVTATAAPTERTLTRVRALLTLTPRLFGELLEQMSESAAVNGLVARGAARILQKAEKERSGVISSAQSHTHFLDSPRMARVLGRSTLDLADLKRERMSLYLVVPPDRLDTYHRWLRLMVACCLTMVTRTPGVPSARIVFLLDEFAHLGKMQPVARDIALVGGYGASFWLFVQDLSQLRAVYPDQWHSFLANADVLQAFGTNDWETAEYLSKMTGDATIRVESDNQSRGVSHGRQGSRQEGHAVTQAERGRRLLLPDEVRRLGPRQLIFPTGSAPVRCERISYLEEQSWVRWYDANPLFVRATALEGGS